MMRSPCGHDAFAVLAQRVLHVSAAARRGAAAYADGCEQIFGHSHLISQSPGLGGGAPAPDQIGKMEDWKTVDRP